MSAFGDLGYPADFPYFKYVNPDAPKGGVYSRSGEQPRLQRFVPHLQLAQRYILKGDGALRAWT